MRIRRLALLGSVVLGMALLGATSAVGLEPPFEQLSELRVENGFSHPTGVAVDQETGNVYVADGAPANSIDVFGPEGGARLSQITGLRFEGEPAELAVDNACYLQHQTPGECIEPFSLSNGDLYVADTLENAIEKFRFTPSPEEEKVAAFSEPNGVAVDPRGNAYVADYSEGITVFNSEGVEVGKIEQKVVANPAFIAVDGVGDVYVGNYGGGVAKLQVNSKDEVLSELLLDETGKAVAVDEKGNVFVDRESSISEYDASGSLIREFGSNTFSGSLGIAVNDATEEVYVSNPGGANVVVFGPLSPVITKAPSSVQARAATLEGTVNPQGSPVEVCAFKYGTSPAYGSTAECSPNPGSGESPVAVSAAVAGLVPNETYHYRLVATTAKGTHQGHDEEFRTPAALAVIGQSPSVSSTTRTSASLAGGAVNPEHSQTYYYLEYGISEGYGSLTPMALAGSELGDVALADEAIGELQAGTLYHYRVVAVNPAGTVSGPDRTFTTAPGMPPIVATGAASEVTLDTARISGTVNTQGLVTTYGFEVGTSTEYGSPAGLGAVGAGASEAAVGVSLRGLRPGTTYHYRITATNSDGTSRGADQTFTTPGLPSQLTLPAVLPLIATPSITFSPEPTTVTARPLTNAQKLSKALKACKRKPKSKRVSCRRQARKKYAKKK